MNEMIKELFYLVAQTNKRMEIIEKQMDTLLEVSKVLYDIIEAIEDDAG